MKNTISLILAGSIIACSTPKEEKIETSDNNSNVNQQEEVSFNEEGIKNGYWLGRLSINEKNHIPFNMIFENDSVYFLNAGEKIGAAIEKNEDELLEVKLPIFDSKIKFSKEENKLFGYWFNYAKGENYKLDFRAEPINNLSERFIVEKRTDNSYFDGQWEVTFSKGTADEYKAIGIFNQDGQNVNGTFITEVGDYRFLQGNIVGDSMYLSAFDGAHAFLFKAKLDGDTVKGMFYSGSHWSESWEGFLNSSYELKDPYSLTSVVNSNAIEFEFPDLDKKPIKFPDPKYTDKVVIIQLLGSWCPNCMDETKFLVELYNQYHSRGLEIIGLAFEAPKTLDKKIERVNDLKEHFKIPYELLIGGNADKKEAEKSLPFLNNIVSFPTTIILNRDGQVERVHAGFYGPGTGSYYIKYMEDTKKLIEKLL